MRRIWQTVNRGQKQKVDYRSQYPVTCLPTPAGAWALMHSDLSYHPPDSEETDPDWDPVTGRWYLAYLTPDGKKITADPKSDFSTDFDSCNSECRKFTIRLLTDYDHDGVSEILFTYWTEGCGRRDEEKAFVVTMKNGAIVTYPKIGKFNIVAVRDVDHDGLPDLFTHTPFEEEYWNGNGISFTRGPRLLLHAQADGRFLHDDVQGLLALRRDCPRAPTQILDEAGDEESILRNIACARLRKVKPQRLTAELRQIKPRPCTPTEQLEWCQTALKWATADVAAELAK